jgi:lipoprotein-anchoring transpeptidase ErfK/SrfK
LYRIFMADIATERFWQIAILTAAGAVGLASPAEAARYYWPDDEPGSFQSRPAPAQARPQRLRPRQARKVETPKDAAKPQGALVIAISIERQSLKVYDANGFFAETPISTGMKGHPTPTGVFSIIQKHRLHHSNIYSGAPMPFMQRITWSGIAMHAGALPGYPASHGCIRLPMAFAARMWNWTRMGARVVVTPGEITPARFAHPLLAAQKLPPQLQPTATLEPNLDAPVPAKADKAADAGRTVKPVMSEPSLDLRSSVGHGGTRTADASGASNASVTMSDASSSAADAPRPAHVEAKAEAATAEAEPVAAKPEQIAASDAQPVATNAADAPFASAQANGDAVKADETKVEAKAADAKAEDSVTAATDAGPAAAEAKKDQTRLPITEKPVVAKPEPPKPAGRIAVLVSRKDGKLYVRENFKPLFDVPVTIAQSDRLLGTHVFTAEADKDDANALRWSVVTLPVAARNGQKNDDDERSSRRRRIAGVVPAEVKPSVPAPNTPAEALDRITVPPEAMARIAEALSTGASIVVSDQGINQSGETGEGTDFIVSLR